MNRIVIVDGNSLINRAFFAMSELKTSKGVYTGGALGLTTMIFGLMDEFEPDYFCVAFDMKGPTFRHKTYDQYKGTRKGMPNELAMQMPIVKAILDALKIPRVELQGYEADDLIGTIAHYFADQNIEAHVITGDKDALQLVRENIHVHITKKGITQLKEYKNEDIIEELGVDADHVIDYKGLSGDSADNIPGIPSVGPKTAAKLLAEFGTVENLIQNVEQVSNKRWKNLVIDFADQAMLSKKLATIMINVPVELETDMFKLTDPDMEAAIHLFRQYEMNGLLNRLKVKTEVVEQKTEVERIDVDALIKLIEFEKAFSFKIIYNKVDLRHDDLICAAFKVKDQICIIDNMVDFEKLVPLFEDEKMHKSGFDLKNEYLFLMQKGIDLKGVKFDGYIAAYLLEPSRRSYDLSELVFEQATVKIASEEEVLGKGAKKKTPDQLEQEVLYQYVQGMVMGIDILADKFDDKLEANQFKKLFETVEVPLVKILSDIEFTGFNIDVSEIDHIDELLTGQITEIEKEIYEQAGETFNINSPKQLAVILFEKLGLPPLKKTKTGYSTSHDILEKLASKHAIVAEIIEYRTYTKLKSTYIDGLRAAINPVTGRVHTSLNQTIAVTGRLSSTEPNLQNIPIRLPMGRKIRKFFIPDEGCILLGADYSQIELRVLAHLSKDPALLEAFTQNIDIHTKTASQVFGVETSEVTSLQRSHAKEVNFGIVYGMGDFGLGESLGITRKEAKTYIENYFKSYPNVQGFMDSVIESCKEKGYVETLLGRRRDIADISNSNFMLRSAAERTARNTPIQGSAADIIKIAMIKVFNRLEAEQLKSKLILQVHDELILNVPLDELEQVKVLLKESMESAYELLVPLNVDMNTGASWYDAK
ncbi:DNA polymerase I [Fusibacter ferrireducens]|uniref:DNA polymerase I n=1 Tax=Fusibacter ferrireducens TaxID=2785058 RepID=A0ABR9ZWL8_9FIRM|nr:DNA polymerase I [Fusibacter ferrireducens]MBF4694844.1 DNA polymerase I [Fusibacter ferrireducens]